MARTRVSGLAFLTDAEVLALRQLRASTKADWRVLAKRFGIHSKSAYRICVGICRRNVGGPLEEHVLKPRADPDVATLPRCPVCGCKLLTKHCLKCQGLWQRFILGVLRDSGLLAGRRKKRRRR